MLVLFERERERERERVCFCLGDKTINMTDAINMDHNLFNVVKKQNIEKEHFKSI